MKDIDISDCNSLDELTDAEKSEIRSVYEQYLIKEKKANPEAYEADNMSKTLPFIDRTKQEQQALRERYKDWNWNEQTLENWLICIPELSDPSFTGIWVSGEYPVSNRLVESFFNQIQEKFIDDAISHSQYCVDFMEYAGLINSSTKEPRRCITGWMLALSNLNEQQLSNQASHELRVQVEETQFGANVANELHSKALEIRTLCKEMLALDSYYSAVISGRKNMDVEYQDEEGNFIPSNQFTDKMHTPENIRFIEEIEQKQSEILKKRKAPD